MGLICSGEISDYVFYCLAESSFLLSDEIRSRYNIKTYLRFKDDLFLVLGGCKDSRISLFHQLQAKAVFFRLKVDAVSKKGVDMVDLHVWMGGGVASHRYS